jgi:hypothetical protein
MNALKMQNSPQLTAERNKQKDDLIDLIVAPLAALNQANLDMDVKATEVPENFTPEQIAELVIASAIDPGIVALNFVDIPEGQTCYQYLFYSPKIERTNTGRLTSKTLEIYELLENGGWWASGVDLLNRGDSLWGVYKPNTPRIDESKNKPIKYEHPLKDSRRVFCLKLPQYIWKAIALRNGVKLPSDYENMSQVELWQWAINNPDIERVYCEGVKKAACLLSQGHLAIGLPGIHGGTRSRDEDGDTIPHTLVPDVKQFATKGSKHLICFDNDPKESTRETVRSATERLSNCLKAEGCTVKVIDSKRFGDLKGVDDFIAAKGAEAFEAIHNDAGDVQGWLDAKRESEQSRISRLDIKPHHREIITSSKYISEEGLQYIESFGLYFLPVDMGAGKSRLVEEVLKKYLGRPVISITPTQSLGKEQAYRLKLDWRGDLGVSGKYNAGSVIAQSRKVSICFPSLHQLNKWIKRYMIESPIIILDEVEEGLNFLVDSSLCNKDDTRPANIKALTDLLSQADKNRSLIIACDAGLTNKSVDFITSYTGNLPVTFLKSSYQKKLSKVHFLAGKDKDMDVIIDNALSLNERVVIPCDSQEKAEALEASLIKKFPGIKVLRNDSKSGGNKDAQAAIIDPNKTIALGRYDAIIYTSTCGSGWSITLTEEIAKAHIALSKAEGSEAITQAKNELEIAEKNWENGTPYFSKICAYNTHLVANLMMQMPARYRLPIDLYISSGPDMPSKGCRSHFPYGHLLALNTCAEDMGQICAMAKQNLESQKDDGSAAGLDEVMAHAQEICREALDGKNPVLNLLAENRARNAYLAEDRAKKLRQAYIDRGYELIDLILDEDQEDSELTIYQEIYTEEKEQRIAEKVVTCEIISDTEEKELEAKDFLTEDEDCSLRRKKLENKLPDFLEDSIEEKDRAGFYRAGFMDMSGKIVFKGLENWVSYENQDLLLEIQSDNFLKLIEQCKLSEIGAYQDVVRNNIGMLKFVKDCGIFSTIDFTDLSKTYTKDDFESLVRQLFKSKKAAKQFRAYFNKSEPKTRVITFMNEILTRFGWVLEKEGRGHSCDNYKLKRQLISGMTMESLDKMLEIFKKKLEKDFRKFSFDKEQLAKRENEKELEKSVALEKLKREQLQQSIKVELPTKVEVIQGQDDDLDWLGVDESPVTQSTSTEVNQPQDNDLDWLGVNEETPTQPEVVPTQQLPFNWKGTHFVISSGAQLEKELHREIAARSLVGRADSDPVKVMNQWRVWVTFPDKGCQQIPCDALLAV